MGLFDKLRGNDEGEEVELKLPKSSSFERATKRTRSRERAQEFRAYEGEEVELEDMWDNSRKKRQGSPKKSRSSRSQRTRNNRKGAAEDEEESGDFILPGMKTVSTRDESQEEEPSASSNQKEALGQIIEQNEQIISLLEDMLGKEDDDEGTGFSESNMW